MVVLVYNDCHYSTTFLEVMIEFNKIWSLLYNHGASERYKDDCARLWESYTPVQQQQIFDTISDKLQQDRFVHYNPLRAIRENYRPAQQQTLSYNEYYKRFGTTEEVQGWKKQYLAAEQRTVYILNRY